MLKILELFGGIGACSKALERLGIDYEIVDYVEIDKYAVKSFNAIHNTNFEPQDITQWDKDIEVDLIMHGSPCQDFSLAGKQAGGDKDSGTRSSLMYETIRIVEKLKPKYVIWENVKNLLSKKHRHNFDAYLEAMEQLGYVNYYQVLNAKDYGIPQNRERVFTISILGNGNYNFPEGEECKNKINRKYGLYGQATRWGVYDKNGLAPTITASMGMGGGHVPMVEEFEFPKPQELKTTPLDYIEENVDEKYELTEKNINHYQREFGSKGKELDLSQPIPTLTASMGTGGGNIPYFVFPPKQDLKLKLKDMLENKVDEKYYLSDKMVQYISADNKKWTGNNDKSLINKSIASAINTGEGSRRCDASNYVSNEFEENYNLKEPMIYDDRDKGWGVKITDICPTQRAMRVGIKCIYPDLRIRKLTPKECWRLMGFDDEDYEKASKVNSNTQLYKQAGNSIVVNVLEAIFKNLLEEYIC